MHRAAEGGVLYGDDAHLGRVRVRVRVTVRVRVRVRVRGCVHPNASGLR